MDQPNLNPDKHDARVSQKKKIIIALIVTGALLLVCALIVGGLRLFENSKLDDRTVGTVDPLKLEDTKEEGFDIMEYDEYLGYDRNIYLRENGVELSISESDSGNYGDGFEVMYGVIRAINEGDSRAYNALMGDEGLRKSSFTQQQIYGILITKESETAVKDGGYYTEYVYKVEYKIHENNGSFRRDIESDASRPQYFIINDSTGELLLMDVINRVNEKD
jgi:hypothetical protein